MAREVQAGVAANGGEAASLVESAMLLRWRAPELALLLADRAATAAQDDKMASLRADHLAVFALNRLGRYGEAARRLFPAIRDADTPQALRHELHVELAQCAAALGEPSTALGAVRAVLAAGDDVAPALRGRALVAAAEAATALDHDDLVSAALAEADELYREDQSLDHDTALLLRAAVRATDAARHRARGAAEEAEAKAREGRELLDGLADPDHDSGEVSARLMLELALTLLDRGAGETAAQDVRSLLRRQVRAAAAGAVGRLRLALATRVHLAEGRHEPALTLLADAVEGAQRYGVDAVLAECLEGLSHVHEARNEFADALHCMRAARAAEGRHRGEVAAARSILRANCGSARREEARLVGQVAELLVNAGTGGAGLDADTGALPAEIMNADSPGGIDSWQSKARHRRGEASTLVAVSDLLPVSALLAGRSGRRRAEERARERADEAATVEMHQVTDNNGAESSDGSPQGTDVPGVPPTPVLGHSVVAPPSDSSAAAEAEVSDSAATGGTAVEDTERILVPRREFLISGPPPAPTPRALDWDPADGDSADNADNEETPQMGLGALLAEALAAYQESRDVDADACSTGTLRNDGAFAAEAETVRDVPRYRGPGTRWTAGLTLAASPKDQNASDSDLGVADYGDPAEATTNPLLRLPDLTAEPRWVSPETGRRSAAGD
jgi:hypothetical protein